MDALVPLKIMVAVETLRTLIAFEWSIIRGGWLAVAGVVRRVSSVHVLHTSQMTAGEIGHKPLGHVAHHRHMTIGIVYICQNWPIHGRERV
jgi:hypothetical protein